MLGAEAVIASLEAEGVTTVFGYPGGQAIKLYDALYDSDQITHVLARHEQGAVHMADGYARATGRAGVAIVTSGPGATNTVTGIATAYMDSVPLVVITGQVGAGGHRHRLASKSPTSWASRCPWSSTPTCCNPPTSSPAPSARPSTSPSRGAPAPCSSTSRATWLARPWCSSTRMR